MRSAPLFKGATRPPCVWGIPINAFVVVCGFFLLVSFWVWVPLLLLCPVALYFVRKMADRDDQIFDQLQSNLMFSIVGNQNRSHWPRGITSLSASNHDRSEFVCLKDAD